MVTTSLDRIVRDALMRMGYPIHYYLPFMVAAKNCLAVLSQDDLRVINTKKLTVNKFNEAQIPDDYLDYSAVNIPVGQTLKKLVQDDKINSLANYDANFNQIVYGANGATDMAGPNTIYGYLYPFYLNTTTYNEYGESIGRFFGFGAGIQDDTFKIIPERNVIQMTENLSTNFIVLEYISSGMSSDAATKITSYATETIVSYILWQLKENSRSYGLGERQIAQQEFIFQRKILRARISGLTIEVLKRLSQKASYSSPKTI